MPERENQMKRRHACPYTPLDSPLAARVYNDESQEGDVRSPFQHDKDRILHSSAFRCLQYKTQVYAYHESDLYRTRMTHSLEVAQISRGMAQQLQADKDLAEAIALAHDVGHAPFGHAGEFKLKEMLAEYEIPFEHNIQSYRIVTELEERYASHPGLNLTLATLEGIIRHQSYFDKEEDILNGIPDYLKDKVDPFFPPELPQPGIEAQIVNLADIIAYATHDIEDALTVGLIDWETFKEQVDALNIHFLREIMSGILAKELVVYKKNHPDYSSGNLHKIRVRILSRFIINYLITETVQHTRSILTGLTTSADHLWQTIRKRDKPVVVFPEKLESQVSRLVNDLLYQQVYNEPRVKVMEVKARRILETLFQNFLRQPGILPRPVQDRLRPYFDLSADEKNSHTGKKMLARVVADHVSGMTDKFAMDTYQLLTQAYEKAL